MIGAPKNATFPLPYFPTTNAGYSVPASARPRPATKFATTVASAFGMTRWMDEERNRVVEYIAQQMPQSFEENMFTVVEDGDGDDGDDDGGGNEGDLYERAKHIVLSEKKTSISYLQRRLGVGYNKAATLMEELEDNGIVGPDPGNSGKREILVTKEGHGNPDDDLGNEF